MAETREVTVPDIGDFTDVPVIEILVGPGDSVEVDTPLVTLESDKATMDVPSPFAGTIAELKVKIGDEVSEGSVLMTLEASTDAPETAERAGTPPTGTTPGRSAEEEASPGSSDGARPVYASPSVRKLARERGVDLTTVSGSGRKGRITKEDVEAAAKRLGVPEAAGLPFEIAPWPTVDYAKYGEVDRVPLSRIKRISGPNLARNWVMIPHVTHNDEADITELEAFRKQINAEQDEVKVTMVALLVKACVSALKRFPEFNSSLEGDELVLKRYYNIGFAADTPQGLMVPVIRDADRKGLLEIARDLTELSGKARDGKVSPAEMSGGTFSISSLGGIGGTGFTPIVNAPEVAILGVTRAAMRPTWDGSEFVARLIVPLSLSYDHRVIDGAAAARFVAFLATELADFRRVLL
jgi:pyruvate dehydrogenase E2 component (dihydrolipoamide acetyltransferase)